MTFDKIIYGLSGNDSNEKMTISEIIRLIEILKQEYAPTVEMTKEQYDYIFPLIKEGKELGATFTEFWEVYEFTEPLKTFDMRFDNQEQAMQVWLHPEIIYVVDK